jgi:hypothetical protein
VTISVESELKHINSKYILNEKRITTKFANDCIDFVLLSRNRCLQLQQSHSHSESQSPRPEVSIPFIIAKDFVNYEISIEKPLISIKYVKLDDAVQKFHQVFRDSVGRVANFIRNLVTKQSKNNSTYGYAIMKDLSRGMNAMYEFYIPLHEIIASLKNPTNDSHLHELIINWEEHLTVDPSCLELQDSVPPPPKQVGCRKNGEDIGTLSVNGKDWIYLKRCFMYGSAVVMSPSQVTHPISWLRKNYPNFLSMLKLSLCVELDLPLTTLWIDNNITKEVEAKALPNVRIPPLLDCTKEMTRIDFVQHLAQLRLDDIMAIHILPPFPTNVTADINDAHVKSTEDLRLALWSVLRGIQCSCSSSLVFPPYRLKAFCSLTPSHFTAECNKHVVQNLRYQTPLEDKDVTDYSAFPAMISTLSHSTLANPAHPSVCILLPRHDAMWRMDFPLDYSSHGGFGGMKLALFQLLYQILFTCLASPMTPNLILYPCQSESSQHWTNTLSPARSDVVSKLKVNFEAAARRNFETELQVSTDPITNEVTGTVDPTGLEQVTPPIVVEQFPGPPGPLQQAPSPLVEDEQQPNPPEASEQVSLPILEDDEQLPSPPVPLEQVPSPVPLPAVPAAQPRTSLDGLASVAASVMMDGQLNSSRSASVSALLSQPGALLSSWEPLFSSSPSASQDGIAGVPSPVARVSTGQAIASTGRKRKTPPISRSAST